MIEAIKQDVDLLEEAADWHLRLSEEPQAFSEFEDWQAQSSEHRAAWQQVVRVLGGISQLKPSVQMQQATRPAIQPRKRRVRPWLSAALAAGIAAIALLCYPQASLYWQADYLTGAGEIRQLTLSDGSSVVLGPRSALRSDYQADHRHLQLLSGQAFFDVQRDSQRPFVVQTGSAQVQVVGTAFEVQLDDRQLDVAVQRGLVRVSEQRNGVTRQEDLRSGDALHQNRLTGAMHLSKRPAEQLATWRNGLLLVENASVSDILEQMRRYTPGWIVLADSNLAQRRISGIYDMRNPDRALSALAQSLSTPSQRITPWLRVLGRP